MVVQPGVDDSAVVPALVAGDVMLLLEERHRGGGIDLLDPPGHREPENAAADHRNPTRHAPAPGFLDAMGFRARRERRKNYGRVPVRRQCYGAAGRAAQKMIVCFSFLPRRSPPLRLSRHG